MKNWIRPIKELGACKEALEWAEQFNSLDKAWWACERGDWMLWLAGKFAGEPESDARRPLVLAACECARFALPYVKKGELRPLVAIKTAEAWARGEHGITIKMVRGAAYAASAAASYAYATYAAYAAGGGVAATKLPVLKQCADIVRKHYPEAPRQSK